MTRSGTGSYTRACDSCHRRKIQCDRRPPQCDWCKHHDVICTFDRPFGRRNKTRRSSARSSTRVEYDTAPLQVPTRDAISPVVPPLGASTPHRAPVPTGAASSLPCAGLGGFYFDGLHMGGISSQNGVPFFSERGNEWIQARAGSAPMLRSTWPHATQVHTHIRPPPSRTDGPSKLPERSLVEAYSSIFVKSALRYVFPIVNDASFPDILDRAYDANRDAQSIEATRARACVLAFTAVMIHMEGKLDSCQSLDDEKCAAQAESLMPGVLAEANLESLQVCTMLTMYHIYSGSTSAAGTFVSVACRFALMLGAHLVPVDAGSSRWRPEHQGLDRTHLRGLFWVCYMFDKDLCLRAGYPPVIDDDHCDLTLPRGYKRIENFNNPGDGSDNFPGDMRLSIIKSNAIRLLYCAKAFRKSDAELLRDIRELDDELEAWRVSIPSQHRPTLAPAYRIHLEPAANKSKKVHLIVIHLEYYFLLALFHSASGRCRAWARDGESQLASVTSSQALALQASRSIIVNLAAVADVFNCGDFWFFVLYPIFASLTIFCNILLSPLNPQAEGDTRLLEQVPSLIRGLRARRMHLGDKDRVEQIEDFVLELTRLAKLAISTACQGT